MTPRDRDCRRVLLPIPLSLAVVMVKSKCGHLHILLLILNSFIAFEQRRTGAASALHGDVHSPRTDRIHFELPSWILRATARSILECEQDFWSDVNRALAPRLLPEAGAAHATEKLRYHARRRPPGPIIFGRLWLAFLSSSPMSLASTDIMKKLHELARRRA